MLRRWVPAPVLSHHQHLDAVTWRWKSDEARNSRRVIRGAARHTLGGPLKRSRSRRFFGRSVSSLPESVTEFLPRPIERVGERHHRQQFR